MSSTSTEGGPRFSSEGSYRPQAYRWTRRLQSFYTRMRSEISKPEIKGRPRNHSSEPPPNKIIISPIPPRLPPINTAGINPQAGATGAAVFNATNMLRPALPPLRELLDPLGLDLDPLPATPPKLRSSSHKRRHASKRRRRSSKSKKSRRGHDVPSDSDTSSSSSSSGSSSDLEDAADNLPFTKGKNHISGPLPSPAQAIADGITLYKRAGWAVSVDRFNLEVNRLLGFPFSLVPALLRGHYICPAKVLWPDEYDSKKSPKPTNTFSLIRHVFTAERDWRRVIALIGAAIVFAFPSTEDNMRDYLEHIYNMLALFAENGDWAQIVDYNARLRLAFATQPALSFGNFNSPALLAVRKIATTSGFARQRPPATHAPPHPLPPARTTLSTAQPERT